jgi:hypothetical protein
VTGTAGPGPGPDDSDAQAREDWIRDVDAALSAAGLSTRLKETAGCLDVSAAIDQPGRKPGQVIVDEDGYIELHWWSTPRATPQQVARTITSALATLAAALPASPDSTPP